MDIAEQKMDQIKEGDNILEEMENIRKIYIDFKEQNSNLKHLNEVLNNKLDAKTKLNEHLEEKCANIMIEKEDIIIKLRAEIIALKTMVNKTKEKYRDQQNQYQTMKTQLERENKELDDKYNKVVNAQANFDSDFKKKKIEIKKLNDEFKKYKKESKLLLEEKNLLIKDYEDRVARLNEIKQQQVNMLNKEKEDIENELNISQNQLKILNLKENFYKNKAEKLLVQKEFLVKQIDSSLDTMNNEYNKLKDQEAQKDFMISIKKSNKNLQEVYFTDINNLKYLKEVIDFMNFDELLKNQMISVNQNDGNESERHLVSKSHNTSFRSDSKLSKSAQDKSHRDDKDIEPHTHKERLSLNIKAMRKHTTTQNVVIDAQLNPMQENNPIVFQTLQQPSGFK